MAFRRDEPARVTPVQPSGSQFPSFTSHAAAGASLQRPSTSAGFSHNQSVPVDASSISRAAFLDQQRDRLSQAQSASRTPFPPPRSGAATPFPVPFSHTPSDRPRADSNSSMKAAQSLRPELTDMTGKYYPAGGTHSNNVPHPPPNQPSRDYGGRGASGGTATPLPPTQFVPPALEPRWEPPSTAQPTPALPPRDMSTPKPYRHPILTELLTSPTNTTKYSSAVDKTSTPWDYDNRQQSYSAQGPSVTPPENSTSAQQNQYTPARRDLQPEVARSGLVAQAAVTPHTAADSNVRTYTSASAMSAAGPSSSSRNDIDNASIYAHRAGASTPAVDSTRQRSNNVFSSGASISATMSAVPHNRPSTSAYDSYAPRTTSASNPTVSSSSQAVHRPPPTSYHSSPQVHSQNTVSIPPNTLSTVPTTSSSTAAMRPSTSTSQPKPTSYREPTPMARTSSHDSIMRTPSSLAPSVLKRVPSRTSMSGSVGSQSQETKKKSFLRIFRSKTVSAPTPPSVPTPTPAPTPAPVAPSVQKEERPSGNPPSSRKMRAHLPPPTSVPPPPQDASVPLNVSHTSAFSPFRYLSGKRHRTVSGASLEAVSGTAVS